MTGKSKHNMFTTAQEIIDIIEQRKNRGYGLDHFKQYMASIQNPHEKLSSIHVAGTNGKGSCVNDIRSILQLATYQVGTFTSPYMITHLDRIRVNDVNISEQEFIAITNEFYDSWIQWNLSMFEIDMCIACIYFLCQKVDFCIFEVGLGGRLDSTNILTPLVSVITNIGMDHMELLGDTLEKIAFEKAGIIKDDIALFTAEEKPGCLAVFNEVAKQHHTQCYTLKEISHSSLQGEHIQFDYDGMSAIQLASPASYQCRNAALAIEVIHYLEEKGVLRIDEATIRQGLAQAKWIGRFEIVHRNPLIILDGAHNVDGIRALCESLKEIKNPAIIFSVLKDKNFHAMLKELQQISDTILITQQKNERALDIHQVKQQQGIYLVDSFKEAMRKAYSTHCPIVVTGSLYFISEVRAKWFS